MCLGNQTNGTGQCLLGPAELVSSDGFVWLIKAHLFLFCRWEGKGSEVPKVCSEVTLRAVFGNSGASLIGQNICKESSSVCAGFG